MFEKYTKTCYEVWMGPRITIFHTGTPEANRKKALAYMREIRRVQAGGKPKTWESFTDISVERIRQLPSPVLRKVTRAK